MTEQTVSKKLTKAEIIESIHEATGLMTAAIARDGMSVSVFGVCTAAEL